MSIRTEDWSKWIPYIERLPVDTYYNVERGERLEIQAEGEKVAVVRAAFPGQIWTKVPPNETKMDWWTYETKLPDGRTVQIYADRVGPKSCKRIVETVTSVEKVEVPVTTRTEEREVTKQVVRWECPDEAEAS